MKIDQDLPDILPIIYRLNLSMTASIVSTIVAPNFRSKGIAFPQTLFISPNICIKRLIFELFSFEGFLKLLPQLMQNMVIAILKESNREWIILQTEDKTTIKLYSFSRYIYIFVFFIVIIVFVIAIIIIVVVVVVVVVVVTTTIIIIEWSHFDFYQRICFIFVVWC